MTATLEQTQTELPRLVALANQGEEVLITVEGRAVAKLTGLPKLAIPSHQTWLAELAELRRQGATGKTGGPTVEEILAEDREDRF
jgi:antitoxin (DNA-binding transcriptional repressor) of toxin-antitoxin stability system